MGFADFLTVCDWLTNVVSAVRFPLSVLSPSYFFFFRHTFSINASPMLWAPALLFLAVDPPKTILERTRFGPIETRPSLLPSTHMAYGYAGKLFKMSGSQRTRKRAAWGGAPGQILK